MSEEKTVKLEVPKSLMVALWLIAGGLMVNGFQFLIAEPVNAQSYSTRVNICNANGGGCAHVVKDEGGFLSLMTARY